MSRTVNGEPVLGVKEREVLRKMILKCAEFSGVELLTYAIMDNHFHVLVRVSEQAKDVSDVELMRRFRVLYPKPSKYQPADADALEAKLKQGGQDSDSLRDGLKRRMGDVSEFMRTLKVRYSIWFNKSHDRYGPLWSDRFKSVVVENDPVVVKTVAAYIDLNPVRAGLVKDPKDYRFCGYAEAVAGSKTLRAGISAVLATSDVSQALADYRVVIFGKGTRPKTDGSGVLLDDTSSRRVVAEKGELSTAQMAHQRLKFVTEGAVIGSAAFVESLIREWSPKIRDTRKRKPFRAEMIESLEIASFRRSRQRPQTIG